MRTNPTVHLLALGLFDSGPKLSQRIAAMLQRGNSFSPYVSITRKELGAAALLGLLLFAPHWTAFAQAPERFEVASIKRVDLGGQPEDRRIEISGNRLILRQQNLSECIAWAHGISGLNLTGPHALTDDYYDIVATAPSAVSSAELKRMLQGLLAERFKLVLRRETKTLSNYRLIAGKTGAAMKKVDSQPNRLLWFDMNKATGVLTFKATDQIARLAGFLPAFLDGRPVQDETGLTGVYQIDLNVELNPGVGLPEPGAQFQGFGYTPGIFTAVEQLGLKLESTKSPVEVLVVEHVERPSEN